MEYAAGRAGCRRSAGWPAEFGVTRTMVRHALAVLEAKGLISREVGRGTFLTPASGAALRPATLPSGRFE